MLLDPEVGHWQSSLASVRKLSDTLCVEVFPFKLYFTADVLASSVEPLPSTTTSRCKHDSTLKSLVVFLPRTVFLAAQQSAVE